MIKVEEKESLLRDYLELNNFDSRSTNIVLNSIDDKYGLDINVLSSKIFKKTTKQSRKFVTSLFASDKPDVSILNVVRVLSYSLNLNVNLIINNYKKVKKEYGSRSLTVEFVKELLRIYPEKRVVKLIMADSFSNLYDVVYMMKEIKKERKIDFLPSRPSSLKEIHDSLSRMTLKLKSKNYSLDQRIDVLQLDNIAINDNMTIKVPKTHYDLIDLGEELNFCIGNGYYSREVLERRSSIVSIYNKNKPIYGVQFGRYSIMSAYGFDDKPVPSDILLEIQNALISEPLVSKDFIAITDSSFIHGIKYTNENLYVIMSEKIYIYYDVEQHVYEELIESERKGTYLNRIIKGNYNYELVS